MWGEKSWEDKQKNKTKWLKAKRQEAKERNRRNASWAVRTIWQKWWKEKERWEDTRWKSRQRADRLPPHSHITQFTMFWPIMFYCWSTDSTVVSSDLISQPISFSNVNTKGEAEPLAASSAHLLPQMHNWLPWKEARKDKQQAIILTPVNPNWNPLTINWDNRG